jgi:hypothetical protein
VGCSFASTSSCLCVSDAGTIGPNSVVDYSAFTVFMLRWGIATPESLLKGQCSAPIGCNTLLLTAVVVSCLCLAEVFFALDDGATGLVNKVRHIKRLRRFDSVAVYVDNVARVLYDVAARIVLYRAFGQAQLEQLVLLNNRELQQWHRQRVGSVGGQGLGATAASRELRADDLFAMFDTYASCARWSFHARALSCCVVAVLRSGWCRGDAGAGTHRQLIARAMLRGCVQKRGRWSGLC